ncbi:MAG: endolytic transglycosylase MltG [Nitrospiraceae bacterium]|nr:MAG: endolytic transglycosylase MltG [Nitrospiraceae bacterium]
MKKTALGPKELLSLVISGLFLIVLAVSIFLIAPISFEEKWSEVKIPEGAAYSEALDIIRDAGIMDNTLPLLLLGKLTAKEKHLQPGYYNMSSSMSPLEIFTDLIEGRTITYSVTIPEGTSLKGIHTRFSEVGLVDKESWQLVYDREFLDSLSIEAPSLEGYLYPDTYNFAKGTDPKTIMKIMVQRMREQFTVPLQSRAIELGLSENEVLTLASIIEKEAIYDSERPIISAVYHNRLEKNMRLQADPTVLYGVKKRWIRIRYRDLKRKTPYNTYIIKGLPPGPIASPSIKSIEAALYPADVDYLFFVAKNDGRHYFSTTNAEHTKAVVKYQLNGFNKFDKN